MSRWSRRALLRTAAAGAGIGMFEGAMSRALTPVSLDAVAREKGFRFGSALSTRGLEDAGYVALIEAQCGLLVAENELKMTSIQPAPGEFHFERGDRLLAYAESASLKMRGHTLIWHHPRWMPRWLESYDFGKRPDDAAGQLIAEHVNRTATHFGKRIVSWDVVNEAVDNVTGAMRETRLSSALGGADRVLEIAFRSARAALPDTELVYNDYMGWEPDSAAHRDGVLKLLERLRRRGVPINALGIQAHLGSGNQENNAQRPFDSRDEKAWTSFLREVTGMGYGLLITEFDVHDAQLSGSVAERDARVAALGRQFLDATLAFREVNAVLCWGLCDRYSWLQGRTPRADGLPKRPTPFDAALQAKPLLEAMAAAFRAAPARARTTITGQLA